MTSIPLSRRITFTRIAEHALFWLAALLMLTFFFGSNKPDYWWALMDNLIYLPIHMLYFYAIAYWAMPLWLMHKKYLQFILALFFCVAISGLITRVIDIVYIDPRVYLEYKKVDPSFKWSKIEELSHSSF